MQLATLNERQIADAQPWNAELTLEASLDAESLELQLCENIESLMTPPAPRRLGIGIGLRMTLVALLPALLGSWM